MSEKKATAKVVLNEKNSKTPSPKQSPTIAVDLSPVVQRRSSKRHRIMLSSDEESSNDAPGAKVSKEMSSKKVTSPPKASPKKASPSKSEKAPVEETSASKPSEFFLSS